MLSSYDLPLISFVCIELDLVSDAAGSAYKVEHPASLSVGLTFVLTSTCRVDHDLLILLLKRIPDWILILDKPVYMFFPLL